jgi:ABC-type multidrug transport system fused ATPase/permease subunit
MASIRMATARIMNLRTGAAASAARAGDQEPAWDWAQFRSLLGNRRWLVIALVIASVLSGLTESMILGVMAQGAASLVDGLSHARFGLGPVHVNASLSVLFAFALVVAFIRLGLQVVVSVIPAKIAADLQAQLRSQTFAAFSRASWSEQSRDREGHLQELLTGQIAQAAMGALQATVLIISLTSFVVLVLSALVLNVVAALVVLVAAVALFVLMRPLSRLGSQRARTVSQASLAYAGGVNESVRLAEETHVFGVGTPQRQRIDRLIEAVQRPFFHLQLLARLAPALYQSLIYVLVLAALYGLYVAGAGHVASLGAVVLLLIRAGTYGQQMQGAYQFVRQSIPYLERVRRVNERYAVNAVVDGRRELTSVRTLEFEGVSFEYEPGRSVLSDISFSVPRHETVGVVGPTGAGKSTLVQILLGLREPTSGRYLVNGAPAGQFRRRDWHRAVAYLPQEPRLLHASVTDNIRFLRPIHDEAVRRAAQLAGIHGEIVNWSNGYDTIIGPRADAVSGGQQQRICLARALAAQPEVLVLDEPTSALDPHAEQLIQESLTALEDELTLFVVAHRMSTLDICERVMVIVDGRLQAFDTASTLVRDSVYYRSATGLAVGAASSQAQLST